MSNKLEDTRQCARDLAYFLSLGWKKSDLDMLQKLWWQTLKYRRRAAIASAKERQKE